MIMEDFGHWDALPVKDLFERTLSVPLVTGMTQKDSLVMLLDALDEAAKSADRNRLLQLLTGPFKRLPPNVRMVITSRPYPEVVDRYVPSRRSGTRTLFLSDYL